MINKIPDDKCYPSTFPTIELIIENQMCYPDDNRQRDLQAWVDKERLPAEIMPPARRILATSLPRSSHPEGTPPLGSRTCQGRLACVVHAPLSFCSNAAKIVPRSCLVSLQLRFTWTLLTSQKRMVKSAVTNMLSEPLRTRASCCTLPASGCRAIRSSVHNKQRIQ